MPSKISFFRPDDITSSYAYCYDPAPIEYGMTRQVYARMSGAISRDIGLSESLQSLTRFPLD
jgi:hypothetical protein